MSKVRDGERGISLQGWHTFGLPARALEGVVVREAADFARWGELRASRPLPEVVVGEGSNTVFLRDFPGRVVRIATRGWAVVEDNGRERVVEVAAGEPWAALVERWVAQGWGGVENLAGIPGTAGAAPVQNVGAYGLEIGERLDGVMVWSRESGRREWWPRERLGLGYRQSCLKGESEWVVERVRLRLPRQGRLRLEYPGISEWLQMQGVRVDQLPYAEGVRWVARAVQALRQRRLPDPRVWGNAGSFFLNPIVRVEQAEELRARGSIVKFWPVTVERVKVSAAALIEAAGLRGARVGRAAVSEQHALVLVNLGGATGAELAALIRWVVEAVAEQFGVVLEVEPRLVGGEAFGLREWESRIEGKGDVALGSRG
ncbi:MAG: UDP-N-acetylmuramate dehydrogenase [Hydrogenophilus sp.]|nr:UDP-N-acetylmuramate dehydrogenase [Hydrogenophilus sp.]